MFPHIEENEMLSQFDRWGEIPRFVLEKNETSENSLENAIVTNNLKKCIQSIGGIDSPDYISLLHGKLFEKYVHNILRKEGTFHTRNLVEYYFQLAYENIAYVDSLIPNVGLFQMTISQKHYIKSWKDNDDYDHLPHEVAQEILDQN
ncbi:15989_t:CDS:2 [Entrophospora sp. SA101]|nr:15989_t:CDS:2 [Entrophospora sp. SA101]CAJ0855365.1 22604_t:CDS:2 [Entrophospora sp. SA101]